MIDHKLKRKLSRCLAGSACKNQVVDLLGERQHRLQNAAPFVRQRYRVCASVLFCAPPFQQPFLFQPPNDIPNGRPIGARTFYQAGAAQTFIGRHSEQHRELSRRQTAGRDMRLENIIGTLPNPVQKMSWRPVQPTTSTVFLSDVFHGAFPDGEGTVF
jgi:hypothetical protein